MLEELAEVIEVHSGYIVVSSSRLSACNACKANNNCGQKTLAGLFGDKKISLRLQNPTGLPVEPGQFVILGLHEHALLKSSLLLYLVPLLSMITLAVLASFLDATEGVTIMFGFIGLMFGFISSRKLSLNLLSNPVYTPRLLKIAH